MPQLTYKQKCRKLNQDFYDWQGVWIIQGQQVKKIESNFFQIEKRKLTLWQRWTFFKRQILSFLAKPKMWSEPSDYSIKLVLIGDHCVKKTHFLLAYTSQV